MSNSQLNIPKKIKVGYQNRSDTFTKKLAYVIYYDEKGVLRKEKSWQSWRDDKIDPQEFDNVPTEGFVLNKKVGGYKSDWNFRNAYIRVYDPRGFEFEIAVSNLLFILANCDCSRGKGLEGKFVYSWDGTELVLLPVECEEYKKSVHFTSLKVKNVPAKEMKIGTSYLFKDQKLRTYICRSDVFESPFDEKVLKKQYVFYDGENYSFYSDTKKVSEAVGVDPNYSSILCDFNNSHYTSRPKRIFLVEFTPKDDDWNYYCKNCDGAFYIGNAWGFNNPDYSYKISIKSGVLEREYIWRGDGNRSGKVSTTAVVEFENGSKYKVQSYYIGEKYGEEE